MALRLNKKTDIGVTVNDAYCRVGSINNLDKNQMIINIEYSVDNISMPFLVERKSIDFVLDGSNPFKQAYEYLKTLEEFKDAEDC